MNVDENKSFWNAEWLCKKRNVSENIALISVTRLN